MELIELAQRLSGLSGPSGFEGAVSEYVANYLHPFADEVYTDVLGSVMAYKRCDRPGAKTVLLDAHMDEIGLITTGVKDGFLSFATLGGVDPRMLPAREVRVLTDPPLYGVIAAMPPHVLSEEEKGKSVPADKLYIDVGLDRQTAEKLVPPGTPVVYVGACEELGERQLCGKALDDRACAAIIIKTFERLCEKELNVDVCCLVSTQEEVGHRGARVAAWRVRPQAALVVDVTHGRTPDAPQVVCQCGKGPAVGIGPNMNRTMAMELLALAEKLGIPCQREAEPGGNSGTNAEAVQVSRTGVATALVSLPLKYMHTPVETVTREDMTACVELLAAYVENMEV